MTFACFACGFNCLHQIDGSKDGMREMWTEIADGLKKEPCLSISWDSIYMESAPGSC